MIHHRLQLTDSKTEVLVFTTPSLAGKHNLTGVIGVSILKPTTQQTYKYWTNAGVIYWRATCVPLPVQTVMSQYTGHTVIKVDVLACFGPALARLYRPSIGPLVSAQHWPACIGPALARYQPVSTLFRKMSQGKFFLANQLPSLATWELCLTVRSI